MRSESIRTDGFNSIIGGYNKAPFPQTILTNVAVPTFINLEIENDRERREREGGRGREGGAT